MAERQSHDIKPGTSTASGKQACSLHSYLIYISTESECQLVNHVERVMDLSPSKICQMYLARRGFLAWRSSSNYRRIGRGRRHNNTTLLLVTVMNT